jgi:hypothetical protein
MGQFLGVLPNGDGVQVDDAKDTLVVVLQAHPVADRSEIVAEVKIACGLNA